MKSLSILSLFGLLILIAGCGQEPEVKAPPALDTEEAQRAYAVGISAGKALSNNLSAIEGTDIKVDTELLIAGFSDGLKGEARLDEKAINAAFRDFRAEVNKSMQAKRDKDLANQAQIATKNIATGTQYLAKNATEEGVVKLESGLQYKVITAGEGKSPAKTDRVKVNYRGTLVDGTQFDSSYDRGQPAVFAVNRVIKGWQEGIPMMKEGGKWEFYIPSSLAYGNQNRRNIPPGSVLKFEVELLEVLSAPETKPTDK